MHSLFRIDKNSLPANNAKTAGVAVLPGFDDMIAHHETKVEEQAPVAETEAVEPAKPKRDPLEEAVTAKRAELDAMTKQVDAAKKQAEQLVADARSEADGIRDAARQEGHAEGVAQAQAAVAAERQSEKMAVEDSLVTLSRAKDEIFSQLEESVLDLSMYIAERIIKTEVAKNDEIFVNIVKNTLKRLKNQTEITIKVGKEEYEKLHGEAGQEFMQELSNSGINIKQDLALDNGDLVVETEYGTINAGIRTQLKRLGYAMREA